MNSKQRVLAAVERRPTDRTPITFDAEAEVYQALYQHFGIAEASDPKAQLFDRLGVDTWMVLPGNYITPESERDKNDRRTIWGWGTTMVNYSGGRYEELSISPLAGEQPIEAIDRHPWPDVSAQDYSSFAADVAAHSARAIIGASSWGAYFISAFLRGMEDIMMDFAANQAFAAKLIDAAAQRVLAFMDNMLAHGEGIDIVYMSDDYCSQRAPLFSPDIFKRMVVPYLAKAVEKAHAHDKKFLLHVCGAVRPLLPMIIDCGVDMLEPIQVRAEGMEPAALKRDFGRHLTFYGGLDLQQVLCKGTPNTVADETRRLIDILGDGGGYVFGPGHTYIQPDAPLENILAMYETARTHGR